MPGWDSAAQESRRLDAGATAFAALVVPERVVAAGVHRGAGAPDDADLDFAQIMREMRQLLNFATEQSLPVAGEIRGLMRFLRLSFEGRTSELDSSVFDRLGGFLADDIPAVLPFEFDSNDK